ncbi:MAG: hypothetical protein ICV60_13330 [Pyrinomonadaceae bacterium]|nr:hypothetical protein [Pyrinomonadaceae bacterium]
MALGGKSYVVLTEGDTEKKVRASESWLEMLRRWIVECPSCSEVWLIVGARENDPYVCKTCGHGFSIRLPTEAADLNGR